MGRNWTESQRNAIRLRNRLLVVSAAAGSGKTSVLTEHIIKMLTDREHPAELSRLLVVTFTRSAASDLRSKISQALSDALAENPNDAHLEKQMMSLGQANISTIDSFFGNEVRAGFSALGLSPDFRIADENELNDIALPIMEDTLSELYEEYTVSNSTSPDKPFARLWKNRFADAMDHLLSNRGNGKIALELWQFYRRFSHYPEGLELLKTYADDLHKFGNGNESFFDTEIGKSVRERLQGFLNDAKAGLDEIAEKFDGSDLCDIYRSTIDSDAEALKELTQALAGSYEDVQSALADFHLADFSRKKIDPTFADLKDTYKDSRNGWKKTVQNFQDRFFSWSPKEITEQLAKHADECSLLYVLFTRFGEKLIAEKRSREFLSFDDMPALLLKLLSDANGNKTPYAVELSDRYDAVFIDEYQDVDPIQDKIFTLIGGDRRFMVGDIKQSIYGFRGGEPSIFADYRKELPLYDETHDDGRSGVCIFMSHNFRCSRPVIDYANKICSFLFSASPKSVGYRPQDDLVCGKESPEDKILPVRTVLFEGPPRKNKGDADGENTDAEDTKKECREALWVAKEIGRLIREEKKENGDPIQAKDIAILFRKSKPMGIFAQALKAVGIPYVTASSDNLLSEPLMIDTLNFLRAVDNPQRDLPLSEYLLSSLGGFSLSKLGDIRAVNPEKCSLYDSMQEMSRAESDPLGEKCADFVARLEKFRRLSSVQPADRFLKLLFSEPPFSDYAETTELRALYEEARKCVSFAWCGLYGFLNHIDRLSDSRDGLPAGGFGQAVDAVTLTTVHKSKGLEYPVVFFSDFGSPFSRQATDATLIFHKSVGIASKLFNPENSENENSILRSTVAKAVEEDEREEDIRIIYVALTRAKERLYVTGTPSGVAKLDTYASSAKCVKKDRRSQILGVSNRLVWLYSALGEENIERIPYDEDSSVEEKPSTDAEAEPLKEVANKSEKDEVPEDFAPEDFAPDFYPYSALRDVPTKAPASSLCPDYLDKILQSSEDSPESIATAIGIVRDDVTDFDSLLLQRKVTSPTDFGTAMHAFLEACDFKNLGVCGVDAELKRLQEYGILTDDTVSILNKKQLERFRKSPLMTSILNAKEVIREQKFGIHLPIAKLTRHPERFANVENERIFVQGSIDLLLVMPDGSIRLYDYKTDRLDEDEYRDTDKLRADLTARHADQLACYSKAVQSLFGKQPDFIGIYSFPLGNAIAIDIDKNLFA